VVGAERVLEAGVGGAGIDEEGVAELPNIAEPLDGGRVQDLQRRSVQPDVVPQRVANDLKAVGRMGGWPDGQGNLPGGRAEGSWGRVGPRRPRTAESDGAVVAVWSWASGQPPMGPAAATALSTSAAYWAKLSRNIFASFFACAS
jgi:hypothetical protein